MTVLLLNIASINGLIRHHENMRHNFAPILVCDYAADRYFFQHLSLSTIQFSLEGLTKALNSVRRFKNGYPNYCDPVL